MIPGKDFIRDMLRADGLDIVDAYANVDAFLDCNSNGTDDEVEVAAGSSRNCDGGGTPDECELDCNGNGVVGELRESSCAP